MFSVKRIGYPGHGWHGGARQHDSGYRNNNDPLSTPITPENAVEQAKKLDALRTAMEK